MFIVELFQSAIVAIVVGFLAFSNGIADYIIAVSSPAILETNQIISEPAETNEVEDKTLAHIESKYELGGAIPQILIENADYQQAAVGASQGGETTKSEKAEKSIEEEIAASLVNVYCQYKKGNLIRTTTGTGFFIHQNGVVLTNAHVAQFLLFEEIDTVRNAHCVLRAGNPAKPRYEAKLLYISPAWISQNADLIEAEDPAGTGERDYALLYVSTSTPGHTMPEQFPALSFDTSLLPRSTGGQTVLAGGYPAHQLAEGGPETALIPRVASTSVGELYTFGSNYADVFTIKNSAVGERGASGGPVVTKNGDSIGLIVTKGHEKTEGIMSLRALTLSYIDRTIKEETGFSLRESINGNLEYRSGVFRRALTPFLSRLLSQNLE